MDKLVYLLPALGCAVMMGAMMWMMNRGDHRTAAQPPQQDPDTAAQIAALQAEIALLRAEKSNPTHATTRGPA